MPPPLLIGPFLLKEPENLSALGVLVQRCKPAVQLLLRNSTSALRRAASLQEPGCSNGANQTHLDATTSYTTVRTEGCLKRARTAFDAPWLSHLRGGQLALEQQEYAGILQCHHSIETVASQASKLCSRDLAYEDRPYTRHCKPADPCVRLKGALFNAENQFSIPLGLPRPHGVRATSLHFLQPIWRSSRRSSPAISRSCGAVDPSARCFHSAPNQSAAAFENIGEASARRATALEYKISVDEAIHKFQEWAAGHWLGPISGVEDHTDRSSFSSIRAAYQPFWVFDAKVTTIFTGEIGFDYSTTTYNSTTRRSESTSGTVWRQAPYTHNLRNEHPGDQPDMQVYASYRYRQAYMQCLKGEPVVNENKPLTAEMLADGRELDPFTMKREIAWRRVREKIQKKEVRKAEEFLRTTYHADQARNIQLQMQFDTVRARAVYVPAYVLEYQHAGQFFRAVVHGATGEVGAERHLSAVKVGGLVATGLTAASVATHYLGWGTLFGGAWGVALIAGLSAVAGYAAERWLPRLSAYVKELQHGRDVFEDTARAARSSGAEEAGMEDDDDDRERREHWQRQRRYQEWQGFGAGNLNEQFERIMREFEEQFRRQGGPGFGPFGVPPEWEQRYDRSGFDARRQGERQRQQQAAYEEQYRRRQAGSRSQTQTRPGYRSGDPLGYYSELGLSKGARSSEEEIKAAFRRLALEWHPDRHSKDSNGKAKAEEKFKKISQAYQVLRDPRKKANYDAGFAG